MVEKHAQVRNKKFVALWIASSLGATRGRLATRRLWSGPDLSTSHDMHLEGDKLVQPMKFKHAIRPVVLRLVALVLPVALVLRLVALVLRLVRRRALVVLAGK